MRERTFDPTPGVITAPPLGLTPGPDMKSGAPSASVSRASASAEERTYYTQDGKRIHIRVSDGYRPNPAADQNLANFLGSLLHADELDGLHVYVALPREIPRICGAGTAACYFRRSETIIVVGEESYAGFPTDYVLAHEYGHHVQNNRRNKPFPGGPWRFGTKRWATVERICPGLLTGRYSLDYDRGYFRYPSEAQAEAYAYYHYPGRIPWQWVRSLKPNQRSFDAIETDVLDAWTGPEQIVLSGEVIAGAERSDRIAFTTPLDGGLRVRLDGPPGSDLDLRLFKRGVRLRTSLRPGPREGITYLVCGVRRFSAGVTAVRGGGSYQLTITRP